MLWMRTLSVGLLCLMTGGRSQPIWSPQPVSGGGDNSITSDEINFSYIIMISKWLLSESDVNVAIMVESDPDQEIYLHAAFEIFDTSIVIFDNVKATNIQSKDFTVPIVNSSQPAFLTVSFSDGNTVKKTERQTIIVNNQQNGCTSQSGKPIYNPGDTVQCRFFCLTPEMKTVDQNVTNVRFLEPSGACIAQVRNPEPKNGVVELEFATSEDATSGYYQIIFENEGKGVIYTAYTQVKRYTLPRFSSNVACPGAVSVVDKVVNISVSSQYIYNKPVSGEVITKCCRGIQYTYGRASNCYKGLEEICSNYIDELDANGTYSNMMPLDVFKLQLSGLSNSITCDISVRESGTGVVDTQSCYISVTNRPISIQIEYSPSGQYFKRGIDLVCTAILTDEHGKPLAGEIITVEVDGASAKKSITDADGRADCSTDTSSYFKPNITLRVSYQDENQCYVNDYSGVDYPYDERTIYRFYAHSNSYVQIKAPRGQLNCNQMYNIEVEFIVRGKAAEGDAAKKTFYYIIKAREGIVAYGSQEVDLTISKNGSFILPINVSFQFATSANILVFARVDNELISDSVPLDIQPCFNNLVSLSVDQTVVTPGSEVDLHINAAPDSLCFQRVLDARLKLQYPYDPFNPTSIFYLFPSFFDYTYDGINDVQPKQPCVDPNKVLYCDGWYGRPDSSPTDGDTFSNLKNLDMNFVTDLDTEKMVVCGMESQPPRVPIMFSTLSASAKVAGAAASTSADTIVTDRTNFADFTGWQSVLADSNGRATITTTLPDSITVWNADTFCTSDVAGFGMTIQDTNITATEELFAEVLAAPFAIRGESIQLIVQFASYLDHCTQASVTVLLDDLPKFQNEICICPGERPVQDVPLDFNTVGLINITGIIETQSSSGTCGGSNDIPQVPRKDMVTIGINVQPEGIKTEKTYTYLLAVNDANSEREIGIQSQNYLVPDSAAFTLQVVGDPVGLSVQNMANLLQQVDSSCTQNLALLTPIVELVEFLQYTGKLSKELLEKAKTAISAAWARHLACRQNEGYFSQYFRSIIRSSWIDIYTLEASCKIQNYTFVDPIIPTRLSLVLSQQQNLTSGCINPIGCPFTDQSRINDVIRFTATAALILLKCPMTSVGPAILDGTMQCIDAVRFEEQDTCTQAYLFHAAAVRKQTDKCKSMYAILQGKVIREGLMAHWECESSSENVVVTANICSGIMKCIDMTQEIKDFLGPVAVYLISQLNPSGGFQNSQDTVEAMDALTLYGRLLGNVGDTNAVISVKNGDTVVANITVNEDNKFVVQSQKLSNNSYGTFKISATGSGNLLVQITNSYNTMIPKEDSPFSFTVTAQAECIGGVATVYNISICASYIGNRTTTNNVQIDFKSLTGCTVDGYSMYKWACLRGVLKTHATPAIICNCS
ncbi:ovostatin homolog [Pseudophryne corroboree]|uniref:ovostatin homolog n=1 Tax=Pseudophryne corroboree TaxID=495146 RepID=UPI0030817A60